MSDWYYAADNEQKGPINESELKADLATNKLPADTLVWKDGMEAWTPANQVPAFSFRQPPIPAKVQPPATTTVATTTATTPAVANPESSTTPVDLKSLFGKGEALEVDPEDAEKNKTFGILAYVIFFLPLIVAKDSPFAKYHANQGLVLLLTWIAASIILAVGAFLPFVGIIFAIVHYAAYLVFLVFIILGIINAANGKCVPLPVIGGVKLIK